LAACGSREVSAAFRATDVKLRITLYAEGFGELGGEWTELPAPGAELAEEHLGAAHSIARTALKAASEPTVHDVAYLSPLRTNARHVRGNDLISKIVLRRILTWPDPKRAPHIAIVFVDQDGDKKRKRQLMEWTADLSRPRVIAVPIPEFESWLLADEVAASRVLEVKIQTPPAPEGLGRTRAKALLDEWLSQSTATTTRGSSRVAPASLRRRIAEAISVDRLSRLGSFQDFVADCRTAIATVAA